MAEMVITWDNGAVDDVLLERHTLARSEQEVVRRALIDLRPTRTSEPHLYRVFDPIEGEGTAEVFGLGKNGLNIVSEMIQIIEVNRTIGMDEPSYMEELPVGMQGIALRTPNPYVQLAFASAFIGLCPFVVWTSVYRFPGLVLLVQCVFALCFGRGPLGRRVVLQTWLATSRVVARCPCAGEARRREDARIAPSLALSGADPT